MYKFPAERTAWMDSQRDWTFATVTPVQNSKCFVNSCNKENEDLDDVDDSGWCRECENGGMKLWFCPNHESHCETIDTSSHNLMIGRQMTVSQMLRSNSDLCNNLTVTAGQIQEVVCICDNEKWHAGDIFGSSFASFHNRKKIIRHFDARTAISWDAYPTDDKINGDILVIFSMIIDLFINCR